MIALARSGSITRFLQSTPRLASVARDLVGGADEDAALRTALDLRHRGIRASLFFLGEYITDPAITRQTVDSLVRLLPQLDEHGLDTHISVDTTQIGYSIRPELGEENALRLAAAFPAQRSPHSFLMLDMEDASYVDCTIRLRNLLARRGVPAAITLQAYLRRTEADLAGLLDERVPSVRLVKGAFFEPRAVAWTHPAEIRAAYMRLAGQMLSEQARAAGLFPVFATHNEALIDSLRTLARQSGYAPGQYEFEMLYGVRPALQAKILASGDQLRLYVPYGAHWWPYTARRIGENPQNLLFVWRALAGRKRRAALET
jgi:proline dehydrogenase